MKSSLIIVCLAVMAGIWRSADAVTCYECSSIDTSSCNDPFVAATTTCTGESCVKAYGKASGVTAVQRGCSDVAYEDGCIDYSLGVIKGKGCFCSTALCNSASAVSISRLAILLGTLLAVFRAIRG